MELEWKITSTYNDIIRKEVTRYSLTGTPSKFIISAKPGSVFWRYDHDIFGRAKGVEEAKGIILAHLVANRMTS